VAVAGDDPDHHGIWIADDRVKDVSMSYFAYPGMALWLIAPATFIIAMVLRARQRARALHAFGTVPTVERMLPSGLAYRRKWVSVCTLAGLIFWVIALAGPLLGSRLVEFKQHGLDVFIAVDCSLSMQAEDFKPSRMAQAKLLLGQLIDRLAGDRIGIIAFAGQAYVECPLTIDSNAARQVLETIDIGTVPLPGTVIGDAIRTALKGMKAGESGTRTLILLTDGEDHHSDPAGAAKEAAKAGMKIYAIGIGSAQGEPIPVLDEQGNRTGYKRDKKGEVVMSKMDEKALLEIAQETGGQYFRATQTGDETEQIAQVLETLKHGDQKTRMFNRFENRYQWPLAAGLVFFLIGLGIPERGWREE
jgi:Ca-activated chloride channel family protein